MNALLSCLPLLVAVQLAVASPQDELFSAIRAKNLTAISVAVNAGANPNGKDEKGRSALAIARDDAHSVDVFVHLLRGGADPNGSSEPSGNSVLASLMGFDAKEYLQAFVAFGGDLNTPLKNITGVTDTYLIKVVFLGQIDLMTFAIRNGAKTDVHDAKGRSLLKVAIAAGRYEAAYVLLKMGAVDRSADLADNAFPELEPAANLPARAEYWRQKLVQQLEIERAKRPREHN